MHRRGARGWRLARACALTVATLVLSCAAHLLGGGQAPSSLAIAGLGAPILVAAFLLVGRRRGPLTVGAALVIGQATVHESLMRMSMPVTQAAVPGGHLMSHPLHVTGSAASAASAPHQLAPTLSMLAWHALAAAAIAAGLAFGERAVRYLLQCVVLPRPSVVHLDAPVVAAPVRVAGHLPGIGRPWLISVSRRGPPGVAANVS